QRLSDPALTGGQVWDPKNYDGKYDGPMQLRTALARSKNMVSIRLLQSIGTRYAQSWIQRFGFEAEKHPPYLTMALGAGSVTPLQLLAGYAVFSNGGYKIDPYLIRTITWIQAIERSLSRSPERRPSAPDGVNLIGNDWQFSDAPSVPGVQP
ncbi:MAG: hypothetical protein EBX53_12185, partial [Betaproteobacteria bacterium]|nr:hypothetical protein [Betaproteobacteria bacterium]